MTLYPPEITQNILHLNPDLRSDKPSTSSLSNGTALKGVAQKHIHFGKERELYLDCMSQDILHSRVATSCCASSRRR